LLFNAICAAASSSASAADSATFGQPNRQRLYHDR
jgi:hypothetical protein